MSEAANAKGSSGERRNVLVTGGHGTRGRLRCTVDKPERMDRREVAEVTRNSVIRRSIGAMLFAGAIGAAVVAPGQASAAPHNETAPGFSVVDQIPGRHDAASPFVGTWTGHGRGITLYPNGFAKVSLASGAANWERWDARWRPAGRGISVTYVKRTASQGYVGTGIHRGTQWYGSLKRVRGHTVLEFNQLSGIYWCTPRGNNAGLCGA